jgi:hypothetical protein
MGLKPCLTRAVLTKLEIVSLIYGIMHKAAFSVGLGAMVMSLIAGAI